MEKHEAGCTLNPGRICRWHFDEQYDISNIVQKYSNLDLPHSFNMEDDP
jgi:hypothetical protein